MQLEIDSARLLLYRSAWLVDQGIANPKESAMANLASSETYVRTALNGMRVLGGWAILWNSTCSAIFAIRSSRKLAAAPPKSCA